MDPLLWDGLQVSPNIGWPLSQVLSHYFPSASYGKIRLQDKSFFFFGWVVVQISLFIFCRVHSHAKENNCRFEGSMQAPTYPLYSLHSVSRVNDVLSNETPPSVFREQHFVLAIAYVVQGSPQYHLSYNLTKCNPVTGSLAWLQKMARPDSVSSSTWNPHHGHLYRFHCNIYPTILSCLPIPAISASTLYLYLFPSMNFPYSCPFLYPVYPQYLFYVPFSGCPCIPLYHSSLPKL